MFHHALTTFFGNGPAASIVSQVLDLVLGGLLLAFVVYVAVTTGSSLDTEQASLPARHVAALASERRRPKFEGLLKARSITECSNLVLAADRELPEFEKSLQRARIVDDKNARASASLPLSSRVVDSVASVPVLIPLSVAIPAPLPLGKAPLVIDWVLQPQLVLSTVDGQQLPLAPVELMEFEWNPVTVVCTPPAQTRPSVPRPTPVCSPVLFHGEAQTDMEWEQTIEVVIVNQPDNSSGSTQTKNSAPTVDEQGEVMEDGPVDVKSFNDSTDVAIAPAAPAAAAVSNPVAPAPAPAPAPLVVPVIVSAPASAAASAPSAAPPSSTTFNFAAPTTSLGPAMPATGAVFGNTSMVTNSDLINAPATRRKAKPVSRKR